MIFVWGSRLYGKVDEVPGFFYVATKFGHLWYIPLIPMGTHLIVREDDEGNWEGVKLPFSFKSFGVAWLRAALVLGSLWSAFGLVASVVTFDVFGGLINGVILAALIGVFVLSKKAPAINRCTRARALDLAREAGFDDAGLELVDSHFMALEAAKNFR